MVLVEVREAIIEQDRRLEIARNLKFQRADKGLDGVITVRHAFTVAPPLGRSASCAI